MDRATFAACAYEAYRSIWAIVKACPFEPDRIDLIPLADRLGRAYGHALDDATIEKAIRASLEIVNIERMLANPR